MGRNGSSRGVSRLKPFSWLDDDSSQSDSWSDFHSPGFPRGFGGFADQSSPCEAFLVSPLGLMSACSNEESRLTKCLPPTDRYGAAGLRLGRSDGDVLVSVESK